MRSKLLAALFLPLFLSAVPPGNAASRDVERYSWLRVCFAALGHAATLSKQTRYESFGVRLVNTQGFEVGRRLGYSDKKIKADFAEAFRYWNGKYMEYLRYGSDDRYNANRPQRPGDLYAFDRDRCKQQGMWP